jgi:hypothetical protein
MLEESQLQQARQDEQVEPRSSQPGAKRVLLLHLFAFAPKKGAKEFKPVVDPSALKVWYLARYFDPEHSGACVWSDAEAARYLGVKADTVRKYRNRAEQLGLLRVNVPYLRNGVLHPGKFYLRYTGEEEVAKRYGFSCGRVVAVPVTILRKSYTSIAVHLTTFYGQFTSFLAEYYRPQRKEHGGLDATRRRLEVLPPHRFIPKSERCIFSRQVPRCDGLGELPENHRIRYQQVGELSYPARTDKGTGFRELLELRTAPVVKAELYRYNPKYCRGNIAARIFRYERSKGNNRVYAYVNGAFVRPYGVSQDWVAKKLKLSQTQVSDHLRSIKKAQVRELILTPEKTLQKLQEHPNFDPLNPWCTVVPYDPKKGIDQDLRPGIYTIQRAKRVFGALKLKDPNSLLLFRDGTNIYSFGNGWEVTRIRKKKRREYTKPNRSANSQPYPVKQGTPSGILALVRWRKEQERLATEAEYINQNELNLEEMVRKVTIHTDKKRKLGEATQQILRNIEEFLRIRAGVEAESRVGAEAESRVGVEAESRVGVEAESRVGVEAGLEVGVEADSKGPGLETNATPQRKKAQGRLELG